MHITIYFNDKPLFLSDKLEDELTSWSHHDDAVLIDEFSPAAVNSMIHEMRQAKVHAGIFIHSNLEELKKAFFRKFEVLQAAGGLVKNDRGDILFQYRLNKWDLPKGKLEAGESLEVCAVREVEEETGLKEVELGEPLLVTYHTYDDSGKHMLKETHWFTMRVSGDQKLEPQLEEHITDLRWVSPASIEEVCSNTYQNILLVLKSAGLR
jgi:8-oxo-dGTP pyrophosphatase MutT (NUDIX family)